MDSGSIIKEIINYLETYHFIFLIIYIFLVIIQLIVLYFKRNKTRIFLFAAHKVISFVTIGYLLLYCQNMLGFYLYIIGVLVLVSMCSIIKKEKILILELFLIGEINLIAGLGLLLYSIKL